MIITDAITAKALKIPEYNLPAAITDAKVKQRALDFFKITMPVDLDDVELKLFDQKSKTYILRFETSSLDYMNKLEELKKRNQVLLDLLVEKDAKIKDLEEKLKSQTNVNGNKQRRARPIGA